MCTKLVVSVVIDVSLPTFRSSFCSKNFQCTFAENPTINAQTTRQMLENLEHYNRKMATISTAISAGSPFGLLRLTSWCGHLRLVLTSAWTAIAATQLCSLVGLQVLLTRSTRSHLKLRAETGTFSNPGATVEPRLTRYLPLLTPTPRPPRKARRHGYALICLHR